MATYRGIQVSDRVEHVIRYMDCIDESREALLALEQRWDLLDVLGRVIDVPTEVSRTRKEFGALRAVLIDALAEENLKKVTASIGIRAQVVVDIVVRNLFERTADIGFLATDEDLRGFLSPAATVSDEAIRQRLIEYRAKYSVYKNVVLLDPGGRVRAAADTAGLPDRCGDAFVRQALGTAAPYVESFAPSDLVADAGSQLIYAHRIDDAAGRPLGVLALVFGFAEELAGVFANLLAPGDWTIAALLDAEGRVLASSDAAQLPVATRLAVDPRVDQQIVRLAGRRYIAAARTAGGYQGYAGPGWCGCALIPVEAAFDDDSDDDDDDGAGDRLGDTVACDDDIFSAAMRDIPRRADAIQAALNLTVWNGTLAIADDAAGTGERGDAAARRTLLAEISVTGARTRQVFADAIATLTRTAIGAIVANCAASAALAVDIMDRNLYERANDCRWWALTTRFRDALAAPATIAAARPELTAILRYINDLYTVYTNLILFDRDGRVQAVSDPAQAHLVGGQLPDGLATRFMARAATAFYGVSDCRPTALYGGGATYIYGAPVLHLQEPNRAVGGVAIVFDGIPQLRSMLTDTLPTDAAGDTLPGAISLFVDGAGRIVSSTSDDHPPRHHPRAPDRVHGSGADTTDGVAGQVLCRRHEHQHGLPRIQGAGRRLSQHRPRGLPGAARRAAARRDRRPAGSAELAHRREAIGQRPARRHLPARAPPPRASLRPAGGGDHPRSPGANLGPGTRRRGLCGAWRARRARARSARLFRPAARHRPPPSRHHDRYRTRPAGPRGRCAGRGDDGGARAAGRSRCRRRGERGGGDHPRRRRSDRPARRRRLPGRAVHRASDRGVRRGTRRRSSCIVARAVEVRYSPAPPEHPDTAL